MDWLYSLIAFVVVTAIIIFFVNKMKNDEWEGELFKKRHNPGDMETNESFSLVFKTNEGKKKRFQTKRQIFDTWDVGDSAKKVKGTYFPMKKE